MNQTLTSYEERCKQIGIEPLWRFCGDTDKYPLEKGDIIVIYDSCKVHTSKKGSGKGKQIYFKINIKGTEYLMSPKNFTKFTNEELKVINRRNKIESIIN